MSTNIGLIHKEISKRKCDIKKWDKLIYILFDALPEQWSSLQGKFWIKCLNPLQKIALHQRFALFSAIFNSQYTRNCTNWNRTEWGPPFKLCIQQVHWYLLALKLGAKTAPIVNCASLFFSNAKRAWKKHRLCLGKSWEKHEKFSSFRYVQLQPFRKKESSESRKLNHQILFIAYLTQM